MKTHSITIRFMCQLCHQTFEEVPTFVEHKLQEHSEEFKEIKCILFEERRCDLFDDFSQESPEDVKLFSDAEGNSNDVEVSDAETDDEQTNCSMSSFSKLRQLLERPKESEKPPFPNSNEVPEENLVCLVDPSNVDSVSICSTNSTSEVQETENTNESFAIPNQTFSSNSSPVTRLKSKEFHSTASSHRKGAQQNQFKKWGKKSYFVFPTPSEDDVKDCSNVSLTEWLSNQKKNQLQGQESLTFDPTANIILLEPDPTKKVIVSLSPEHPIECKLCCKKLDSEVKVRIHVAHCWFQNKERHRYCVHCKKSFPWPIHLSYHNLTHHSSEEEKAISRKFKCHLCPKEFPAQYRLRDHLETHKTKDEKRREFICEVCGFANRDKSSLADHLATHSDARPFTCSHPNCGDTFKTRTALYVHNRSHSTTKPFKCEDCQKEFKTKQVLDCHMLTHTNNRRRKSYQCTEPNCDKTCSKPALLKHHMKKVHNIGPDLPTFPCDRCSKSFSNSQNLNDHYVNHTGEWPFKCTEEGCTEGFIRKGHLEDHLRKHRGEVPHHQCYTCGKVFFRLLALNKHMGCHKL